MKKQTVILLFSLFSINSFCAQGLRITGKVIDHESASLERASIVLSKNAVETPVVATAMSNKDGLFELDQLSAGSYILRIYFLGYLPQNINVELQDKNIDLGSITLEFVAQNLDEIQITAEKLSSFADKDIFNLSDIDRRTSANAFEAMKLLPRVLSGTSDQLLTIRGEPIQILVNGVPSTETDLILITPNNIVRVEFYQTPPARYALMGFGAVINVITRENIVGGQITANLQNAVTFPHGNNVLGFRYNFGNSIIGLNYRVRYQSYKHYTLDEQFNYQFNGIEFDKKKTGYNSPWYRLIQMFNINFTNQKTNNYLFSARFSVNTQTLNESTNQRVEQIAPIPEQRSAWNTEENNHVRPALDLYFSKKIDDIRDLSFNVVGTYSDATFFNRYFETTATNDTSFFAETHTYSDRYSLIADAVYSRAFTHDRFSVGVRNMYSFSDQNVSTTRNEHLTSNQNTLYGFAQLSGRRSKFSYSASVGVNHFTFYSRSLAQNYSYWYFRPVISVRYNLDKNSNLRLVYQLNTQNPSLSQLSRNTVMRDMFFAYSGNPELEPFKTHSTTLFYDYTVGRLTLSADASFEYSRNPFLPYFTKESDYILQTLSNLKDAKRYSLFLSAQWFPFESQWLRLRCWGEVFRNENRGVEFSWSHNDYRVVSSVMVQHKKWGGTFYYQSSNRIPNGQLLIGTESVAFIELNYRPIKNMTVLLGLRYPFPELFKYGITSGIYGSDFISRNTFQNWEAANTIYLQFIYTFGFGKQQAEARRRMNNEDTESGIFSRD
jgi:hypothetical protein